MLWPKFDDPQIGLNLALTGAIKEDVYDREQAAWLLTEKLIAAYPQLLKDKYAVDFEAEAPVQDVFEKIAVSRGCLKSGGLLDLDKVVQLVLRDFRSGKTGRVTLDEPDK